RASTSLTYCSATAPRAASSSAAGAGESLAQPASPWVRMKPRARPKARWFRFMIGPGGRRFGQAYTRGPPPGPSAAQHVAHLDQPELGRGLDRVSQDRDVARADDHEQALVRRGRDALEVVEDAQVPVVPAR